MTQGNLINGGTVQWKLINTTDSNLWTSNRTSEPWKFGNGDGSSTMTVPNYLARVI